MARRQVIVKRPAAIPDFGSMTVLCSDNTGTLTEGTLHLRSALDISGRESDEVLFHAYLNSSFQTGFTNPFDEAILRSRDFEVTGYRKLDEVPYDFSRKRLSVLVGRDGGESLLVSKGAVAQILAVCTTAVLPDGREVPLASARPEIERRAEALGRDGLRLLGVAVRPLGERTEMTREQEVDLAFLGLIVVADPPKTDVPAAITELTELGVAVKIISGDSAMVVRYVPNRSACPTPPSSLGPRSEKSTTSSSRFGCA